MNIVLASGNAHKKEEFQHILHPHKIVLPSELDIDFNVAETGNSFAENAVIKAEYLYRMTNRPIIADDSGLCVDALDGAPGIYTARYGDSVLGSSPTSRDRYLHLLDNMKNTSERTARFVCALVYYYQNSRFFCVQETVEGIIVEKEAGSGGFGYDPVFYVPDYNCTMAELNPDIKNKISHRGKATESLKKFLETV